MSILDIFKVNKIKQENEQLKIQFEQLQSQFNELGGKEYFQIKEETAKMEKASQEKIARQESYSQNRLAAMNQEIAEYNKIIADLNKKIIDLKDNEEKLRKKLKTASNKLSRSKELYESVNYAIVNFFNSSPDLRYCKISPSDYDEYQQLYPSVILKLHHMDIKSLRKAYRDNDKQIKKVLEQYENRYTSKANQTIYSLMVIALQAELQNILYNLKYEKLDDAVEQVKNITSKYLSIASNGNQSIAGTITKFIGEIEYLFINAVKIEYNYYIKKEQARQEQLAIREKMRQEAEERKALEAERKKVEKEESKYQSEINKLKEQLTIAQDEEIQKLNERILALQAQLADVVVRKEEISNLANGKAGNVYIISNLGSFGKNMFKIGMTRRLNPQERVNELGDASVPFKFDVHSFIFSEDAVSLENSLHERLNSKRVNKVNLRKEFFYSSVDELETLVNEIDPTAEFNKTMLAEDFRQSISSDEIYTSDFTDSDDDDMDQSLDLSNQIGKGNYDHTLTEDSTKDKVSISDNIDTMSIQKFPPEEKEEEPEEENEEDFEKFI